MAAVLSHSHLYLPMLLPMMSSSASRATITPNTLNAITGILTSGAVVNGTGTSQPHPLSVSHLPPSSHEQWPQNYTNDPVTQANDSQYANSASNTIITAANGLFLLSQAHPELTKLEAQRVSCLDGDNDSTSSNTTDK
jgi:ATF/CREB family transcription factor